MERGILCPFYFLCPFFSCSGMRRRRFFARPPPARRESGTATLVGRSATTASVVALRPSLQFTKLGRSHLRAFLVCCSVRRFFEASRASVLRTKLDAKATYSIFRYLILRMISVVDYCLSSQEYLKTTRRDKPCCMLLPWRK